jgi:enoyl-CoA hydratase/carnithine racemase
VTGQDAVLLTGVTDGVMTITLNRPRVRNALIPEVMHRLADAVTAATADPAVRLVLLAGAGKSFCAGGDAKFPNADFATGWAAFERSVTALRGCPKVTLAKVQGHAIGAGCTLALLADFVLAEEPALFRFPFVAMGLVPEGMHIVARLLRPVAAKRFVLLGESLTGGQAAAAGLIHAAVPPGDLDQATDRLIEQVLALPDPSVLRIKSGLEHAYRSTAEESLEWERRNQAELRVEPGNEQFREQYFGRRGISTGAEP